MKNKFNKFQGPFLLITAAIIWGISFVVQKDAMESGIGGFTFNTIRFFLGSLSLLPIILSQNKKKKQSDFKKTNAVFIKKLKCILPVGICLFFGSNLQQFAFKYTEPGKVGFLTALYMLLVPIFGLFLKKKPPVTVWIGVGLGLCGLYLLCVGTSSTISIGKGEALALSCAVAFALHILTIDKFGAEIDSIELSCGQFFITGVLSSILMFMFEEPTLDMISKGIIPLLYTGILSSGVAFTFQVIGQKNTDPTVSSILLCTESLFSVIFSMILPPHSILSTAEYIGCGIMFTAILIAQIPKKKNS